jgi:hypothetical protein
MFAQYLWVTAKCPCRNDLQFSINRLETPHPRIAAVQSLGRDHCKFCTLTAWHCLLRHTAVTIQTHSSLSLCVPSVSAGNLATSPVPGTVSHSSLASKQALRFRALSHRLSACTPGSKRCPKVLLLLTTRTGHFMKVNHMSTTSPYYTMTQPAQVHSQRGWAGDRGRLPSVGRQQGRTAPWVQQRNERKTTSILQQQHKHSCERTLSTSPGGRSNSACHEAWHRKQGWHLKQG